jgi:hypothetical protein
MIKIDSYWDSDGLPGVLVQYSPEEMGGFELPEGADAWEKVTEWDVVQWFKSGKKLTKSSFENSFGKIGDQLPQLPQG